MEIYFKWYMCPIMSHLWHKFLFVQILLAGRVYFNLNLAFSVFKLNISKKYLYIMLLVVNRVTLRNVNRNRTRGP